MSVTGPVTAPGAPPLGTEPQPRSSAASAVASAPAPAPPPAAAPVVPLAKGPDTAPPPFGFTLHYDDDLHRLILESRDPVTGFVIYQMPPKYIVKQFTATVSPGIAENRGASLDKAI